jgi:hypothetical protein
MPPGFLHGTPERVRASLRQCAPRIAWRLSMWARPPDVRERSPMPPETALESQGTSAAQWVASEDYARLLEWATDSSARAGTGRPPCLAGPATVVVGQGRGQP